jgi:thiamine pyrophosphate-dependent acetolactate synthase large subunit-like protein
VLAGAARDTAEASGHFMALDARSSPAHCEIGGARRDNGRHCATIRQRFDSVMDGRPGPVSCSFPNRRSRDPRCRRMAQRLRRSLVSASSPHAADARSRATLLVGARRPLLFIGAGTRWDARYDSLRRLVDTIELPFYHLSAGPRERCRTVIRSA